MKVEFSRTGPRRYAVRAERAGFPTVQMDPAPGYEEDLPHDLIHFVVEEELEIDRGVFGQLAAGGDAGSFHLPPPQKRSRTWSREHRRTKRRGERLAREGRDDAELSERSASICHFEWLSRSADAERRREAAKMAAYVARVRSECSDAEMERLSDAALDRICERFDHLSELWSSLQVGGSIELEWRG